MGVHRDTISIKGRPVITNMDTMFISLNENDETRVTITGHGFWNNKKISVNNIETTKLQAPLYAKIMHETLRVFLVPRPAPNMDHEYNMFTESLCSYNLFSKSVRDTDKEPTLTTRFPAFTGIEVQPTTVSENKLVIDIPPPVSAGFIDVVVANRGGYSRSSEEYLQSSDQMSKHLTTAFIESSGMIAVGKPTYFMELSSYGVEKFELQTATFRYWKNVIEDEYFDTTALSSIKYKYEFADNKTFNPVLSTITSDEFVEQITISGLDLDTDYYTRIEADIEGNDKIKGGVKTSNVAKKRTNILQLKTKEPFFPGATKVRLYYESDPPVDPDLGVDFNYYVTQDETVETRETEYLTKDFAPELVFDDLEPSTYYAAVEIPDKVSSNIVKIDTRPCSYFNVSVKQINESLPCDTTMSIVISSIPEATIFVYEVTSEQARGVVYPLAVDEHRNNYITVGESFKQPSDGSHPGRLVLESYFPQYLGYISSDMVREQYSSRESNPEVNTHEIQWYDPKFWRDNSNYRANWLSTHKDHLTGGGSIYDGIIPTQFAYLYNVINYISRESNKTNKILYINDSWWGRGQTNYNTNTTTDDDTIISNDAVAWPWYGVHRFWTTFRDVASHAGYQLDRLTGETRANDVPIHANVLSGSDVFNSEDDWLEYFNNYDSIIWVSATQDGYASQSVVEAIHKYMDNGGGLYVVTDHESFTGCANQLVMNYGVQFVNNLKRTPEAQVYNVGVILGNIAYLPTGRHPLLHNIPKDRYLFSNATASAVVPNKTAGKPEVYKSSEFTIPESGDMVITRHNDQSPIMNTPLLLRSTFGCVSSFEDTSTAIGSVDPCSCFSASTVKRGNLLGVEINTHNTRSGTTVWLTERYNSSSTGAVYAIADDQYGNIFMAVGESFKQAGSTIESGRAFYDAGFPKYYSYLPDDVQNDPDFGKNVHWDYLRLRMLDENQSAHWRRKHNQHLNNGGSIYDPEIPGQFSLLYNVLKYIQRRTNPTNKVLYINDYYTGMFRATYSYYGVQRFYHTFKDISEYAGFEFHDLEGRKTIDGNAWGHAAAFRSTSTHATAESWRDYFNNFDIIIVVGVEGNDNPFPSIFTQALDMYFAGGGGLFVTTDHTIGLNRFTSGANAVVKSHGIQFNSRVDRTPSHPAYLVSNIVGDQDYIRSGQHPVFKNLLLTSRVHAGLNEGKIAGITTSSKTSRFLVPPDGRLTVFEHDDGKLFTTGDFYIRTIDGCTAELKDTTPKTIPQAFGGSITSTEIPPTYKSEGDYCKLPPAYVKTEERLNDSDMTNYTSKTSKSPGTTYVPTDTMLTIPTQYGKKAVPVVGSGVIELPGSSNRGSLFGDRSFMTVKRGSTVQHVQRSTIVWFLISPCAGVNEFMINIYTGNNYMMVPVEIAAEIPGYYMRKYSRRQNPSLRGSETWVPDGKSGTHAPVWQSKLPWNPDYPAVYSQRPWMVKTYDQIYKPKMLVGSPYERDFKVDGVDKSKVAYIQATWGMSGDLGVAGRGGQLFVKQLVKTSATEYDWSDWSPPISFWV